MRYCFPVSACAPLCSEFCTQTGARPDFFMPSSCAAAPDISMTLLPEYGPRSFTVTVTLRSLLRLVTLSSVPRGNFLLAAVNAFGSNFSPLAVFWPFILVPYQDAVPVWMHFNGETWAAACAEDSAGTEGRLQPGVIVNRKIIAKIRNSVR